MQPRCVWTPSQDAILQSLIEKHGARRWEFISSHIPGKTAKQCRERWYYHLDPSIRKGSWTTEEDQIICEMVDKIGTKWAQIARALEGRTDNAVKNRFHSALRRTSTGFPTSPNNTTGQDLTIQSFSKMSNSVSLNENRDGNSTSTPTTTVSSNHQVFLPSISQIFQIVGTSEPRAQLLPVNPLLSAAVAGSSSSLSPPPPPATRLPSISSLNDQLTLLSGPTHDNIFHSQHLHPQQQQQLQQLQHQLQQQQRHQHNYSSRSVQHAPLSFGLNAAQ